MYTVLCNKVTVTSKIEGNHIKTFKSHGLVSAMLHLMVNLHLGLTILFRMALMVEVLVVGFARVFQTFNTTTAFNLNYI